ncbi:MAG: DUF4469 domain-containing protein [Cytophagaceae bacterium]|jgi:hypothetical protein|nr:DUF4469 domain-containing protein [Cytophagaceae bacterium]
MKIKYFAVENTMTDAPDDFRMQVTDYETITEKEIFEYVTRPGSGITPAEAKGNYEEFIGAHEYFLGQGYGINTEFIKVRPTLQGTLQGSNDSFDHARHKIKFSVTLGRRYNRTSDSVKVEKIAAPSNAPVPLQLEDITSGSINDILTPQSTAVLRGVRLNFRQDDPEQGIFIIDASKTVTRVERILSHTGTQIVFIVPIKIERGECRIEVRMLPHGNKNVRKGVLPDALTVVE